MTIHCIGGEFARTLKLQVKQQFIKLHVTTSCTGTLVSKEHTLFLWGEGGGLEGEMRGSQNSLTVLFFKDSRKSAYLQLVDKLSASLQIRRINQFPLLALIFFKQSDHTYKKTKTKQEIKEKKNHFFTGTDKKVFTDSDNTSVFKLGQTFQIFTIVCVW